MVERWSAWYRGLDSVSLDSVSVLRAIDAPNSYLLGIGELRVSWAGKVAVVELGGKIGGMNSDGSRDRSTF